MCALHCAWLSKQRFICQDMNISSTCALGYPTLILMSIVILSSLKWVSEKLQWVSIPCLPLLVPVALLKENGIQCSESLWYMLCKQLCLSPPFYVFFFFFLVLGHSLTQLWPYWSSLCISGWPQTQHRFACLCFRECCG